MKIFKLYTAHKRMLADTTTPVSIYLRLRDVFSNTLLLESSDYHSRENSMSYICFDPIAGISLDEKSLRTYFPDGQNYEVPAEGLDLKEQVSRFRNSLNQQCRKSSNLSLMDYSGTLVMKPSNILKTLS
jgi:anthranilate synthase component 1